MAFSYLCAILFNYSMKHKCYKKFLKGNQGRFVQARKDPVELKKKLAFCVTLMVVSNLEIPGKIGRKVEKSKVYHFFLHFPWNQYFCFQFIENS